MGTNRKVKNKMRVIFVSERRADYSRLKPVMQLMKNDPFFDYKLIVTGVSLLKKYGEDIKFIKKLNPQNNENESYPSIYNMREKFINVNNSLKLKDSLRTLKNSYEFNLDQKGKQRCVSKQRIAIFERESQKILKTKNSSNVKPQSNVKIFNRRTLKEYLKRKYYFLI